MSTIIYLLTLCLPLATILIVFGMRYFAKIQEGRARLAYDEAYRQIAERAVAAQSGTATTLSALQTTLAEVQTRLAGVEKILKEVE